MACWTPRSKEAHEALSALRKIQAATEVGVSYVEYRRLLIDAQAAVNTADVVLEDGSIKTELRLTMDSYIDAGTVWQQKSNDEYYYLSSETEPGKSLMRKYTLATVPMEHGRGANADKALHAIWFHANLRLEKLKDLLQPPAQN